MGRVESTQDTDEAQGAYEATVRQMTDDDIRRMFFDPDLRKASSTTDYDCDEGTWDELSERRLFKKILEHKPAGPLKHYHLAMLHNLMNNVYEDEDTDFEDLLTPSDLKELIARREVSQHGKNRGTLVFKPKYSIRPTPEQILAKLETMYKMQAIEANEYTPEVLEVEFDYFLPDGQRELQNEFFLPDGQFGELMKVKDEALHRERDDQSVAGEVSRGSSGTPASKEHRKRRKHHHHSHGGEDSRCSTPKN